MLIDGPMSSRTGKHVAGHPEEFFNQQGSGLIAFQRVTIESLPDDVLLDIFDFRQMAPYRHYSWLRLVHVCRRWRYLVFGSPHRLGLQFLCRATTPVREILDVWPHMQIIIDDSQPTYLGGDNIITALEHRDHMCGVRLSYLTCSLLERLVTVMQEPFPVLTNLDLHYPSYYCQIPPVLPDTFLGGSAPRLGSLHLSGISFPALPKLLPLLARDLVSLVLDMVPRTGYISPEAMVTCLSALTKLEFLTFTFQSLSSCPYQGSQRPPPETRIVLPALTKLEFRGISEYWEDLLARIDTPVIRRIETTFFHQDIFDIPHLLGSVSRPATLEPFKHARLYCYNGISRIDLHPVDRNYGYPFVRIGVLCDAFDWQVSFLVHICNQFSPLLSSVESLYIQCVQMGWQDDMDHPRWLEIFRPFIALRSLHIEPRVVPLIAPALQELTGDRVMEVLPALHSIFLQGNASGSAMRAFDQFITARQLSDHPVTVQPWIQGHSL